MSQSLTKDRPSLDMDEFERRLRQHDAAASRQDDPLAELARLVGEHNDPYGDVFAQEALAQAHPQALHANGRVEPAFGSSAHQPRLSGDFAAIEAGLRGALPGHPEGAATLAADHEFYGQHDQYAAQHEYPHEDQGYAHDQDATQWAAPPQPQMAPIATRRSRRPIYAMAATIAVGVIGVGVAFAYKGTSSSPSTIRTIAAASGPTKIQPPAEASNDQSGQDSAMLGKKGADAPSKLVSREEQPVDVSQAVQENASRDPDAGAGAPGDASSVPVPASPSQASAGPDQMGFGVGMPAPKKVKVVSVRPDGSILQNDAPPAAALPAPRQAAQPDQDPIAQASTPSQASTPETSKPTSAKPSKSKSAASKKTTRVAAAKPKTDDADETPAKPAHDQVASAETDDTTASLGAKSGGGFAVQLAAPGSESDARSTSSRLAKKYSAALSGRHLGFHKAQSNGKSVYRVRVSSLSKADAVSLCEKLKASGGSCFVAKNN